MNSINLLSRIAEFVSQNMYQSIYDTGQFYQTQGSTNIVSGTELKELSNKPIICGTSVCGNKDNIPDEMCMR
jgi:hypothetical protein